MYMRDDDDDTSVVYVWRLGFVYIAVLYTVLKNILHKAFSALLELKWLRVKRPFLAYRSASLPPNPPNQVSTQVSRDTLYERLHTSNMQPGPSAPPTQ